MGFSIGVSGVGRFAPGFISLFKAHPLVDEVCVADIRRGRADRAAAERGLSRTFGSHEELCGSDVDAVAIFSQRQLHGPMTIEALDAGKHVYCAVPISQSIEEIEAIVARVRSSRLIYMTGETSYYYPSTVYCRERFAAGDFGEFVYGEGQYLHDMVDFYNSFRHSGGSDWKRVAGIPPMYYPTHSTSMILSVTGAHATHVSCLGRVDSHDDRIFRIGCKPLGQRLQQRVSLDEDFRRGTAPDQRVSTHRLARHLLGADELVWYEGLFRRAGQQPGLVEPGEP